MQFESPIFALFLIAVIAAVLRALRRKPPTLQVPTAAPFQRAGSRRHTGIGNPAHIPVYLFALAMVCFVFALTRPQQGVEKIVEHQKGLDMMLLLDMSGSMRAYDVPSNMRMQHVPKAIKQNQLERRIEVAKSALRRFIKHRQTDRIGLVGFAKHPYLIAPPTLDHGFLREHLITVESGMFEEDGTALAPPISSAITRLKDSPAKRRVAVLFTDGRNNVQTKVSPMQAAEMAASYNICIYTVGIGSSRVVAMAPSMFGGRQLRRVKSNLDEKLLRNIAEATGGQYYHAKDPQAFRKAMDSINELEKVDLETPRYVNYREIFQPWVAAGMVLITLALLLEHTVLLRIP